MKKHSKIQFSLSNWSSSQFMEIGSVEQTFWSLRSSFDGYVFDWIEIKRSPNRGKVEIDVEVNLGWDSLISRYGETLLDGQESIRFNSDYLILDPINSMRGYVTVHYNSYCEITSKQETVSQTENDIELPSSNAQTAGKKDTATQTENDIEMLTKGKQTAGKKASVTQKEKDLSSVAAKKSFPSPQLVNDFLHMLDNPDSFSDATMICGTSKFPVHRGILAARSPVFTAMFKTQMQEGREGVIDIVDIEPDVLKAMLRYIYGGKTDHLTHSLSGYLLFAADKYQLEELKSICVEELKVSMALNNVFRSLVLGDLHDKSLKEYAVDFICKYKNFSDLEKTEEWQSLMMERPLLAIEVTTAVVKYLQNKGCIKNIPPVD